jgi:hypothetical protein
MFIDRAMNSTTRAPAERNVCSDELRDRAFRSSGARRIFWSFRSINISSVRQEKLGVSNWVQVPVEQGLTNHSYRVLQP